MVVVGVEVEKVVVVVVVVEVVVGVVVGGGGGGDGGGGGGGGMSTYFLSRRIVKRTVCCMETPKFVTANIWLPLSSLLYGNQKVANLVTLFNYISSVLNNYFT